MSNKKVILKLDVDNLKTLEVLKEADGEKYARTTDGIEVTINDKGNFTIDASNYKIN